MVNDVEKLSAKLGAQPFLNLKILKQGSIQIQQARTYQNVAACVPKARAGIGKHEALCIDIVRRIAGIHQ